MIDSEPKQTPQPCEASPLHSDFPFHLHYQQFRRLYLSNRILQTKVEQLLAEKESLLQKLEKAEKGEFAYDNPESAVDDKKKRVRRVASEIKRHYQCQHPSCSKSYGSEGSLNQHIKFKHPNLYSELFKERIQEKVEGLEENGVGEEGGEGIRINPFQGGEEDYGEMLKGEFGEKEEERNQ